MLIRAGKNCDKNESIDTFNNWAQNIEGRLYGVEKFIYKMQREIKNLDRVNEEKESTKILLDTMGKGNSRLEAAFTHVYGKLEKIEDKLDTLLKEIDNLKKKD
jgi:hypothetical protein